MKSSKSGLLSESDARSARSCPASAEIPASPEDVTVLARTAALVCSREMRQRVARNAPHDRIDDEAECRRNLTAQREGFELDIHAAIVFVASRMML